MFASIAADSAKGSKGNVRWPSLTVFEELVLLLVLSLAPSLSICATIPLWLQLALFIKRCCSYCLVQVKNSNFIWHSAACLAACILESLCLCAYFLYSIFLLILPTVCVCVCCLVRQLLHVAILKFQRL